MYRTFVALFVSVVGACTSGAMPAGAETNATEEWTAAHNAGVKSYRNAEYREALEYFNKSWPFAQTSETRGTSANEIGATLHILGRDPEARAWFARAIENWRTVPERSDEIARASIGLADVDRGLSDYAGAEHTLRAALETKPSADFEAWLRNRLAFMLQEQGRNGESRRQYLEAAGLKETSHARQIDSLLGIAELDRQTMRFDDSLAGWAKALDAARGEGSAEFEALALRGLGLTHMNLGHIAQAEPLIKRSLALFEKDPQTPLQELASALQCLAVIHYENRKLALSEQALLRALAYLKQALGEDHPQSAILMESLAELYTEEKKFDEARRYAVRAYDTMRHVLGENSVAAAEALATIGHLEQDNRDPTAAARDFEAALNVMRNSGAGRDQRAYIVMVRYASVLTELKRKNEAGRLKNEIKAFHMR